MAEALAALSVAGTVLQFVDFAGKIIKRTYRFACNANGEAEPESELRTTTADLASLASRLQRPLGQEDGFGPPTRDEQSLKDICYGCERVAQELLRKLQNLDVHGKFRPFNALQRAVVITWTERERKELVLRLQNFQKELDTRILVGLRQVLPKQY